MRLFTELSAPVTPTSRCDRASISRATRRAKRDLRRRFQRPKANASFRTGPLVWPPQLPASCKRLAPRSAQLYASVAD